MKKMTRIIALALCAAVLCLALCSCQYLDSAKANTGVYTDNSMDSLTFRDELYKSVKLPSGLSFIMNDVVSEQYVTTPDVPVLLGSSFGDELDYDRTDAEGLDAPTIVSVFRSYNRFDSRLDSILLDDMTDYTLPEDNYNVRYYVREDAYDRIVKAIEEAVFDHYLTLVYTYDDITVPWQGGKYLPTILDDDVTEVISRTLRNGESVSWSDLPISEWYSIYLMQCDKNKILTDNTGITLLTNSSQYYLFSMNDVSKLYHVSDDDFDVIRKVYSMCENNLEVVDLQFYRENADRLNDSGNLFD